MLKGDLMANINESKEEEERKENKKRRDEVWKSFFPIISPFIKTILKYFSWPDSTVSTAFCPSYKTERAHLFFFFHSLGIPGFGKANMATEAQVTLYQAVRLSLQLHVLLSREANDRVAGNIRGRGMNPTWWQQTKRKWTLKRFIWGLWVLALLHRKLLPLYFLHNPLFHTCLLSPKNACSSANGVNLFRKLSLGEGWSSVGRVLAWHAWGLGFDLQHYINLVWRYMPIIPALER